MFPEAGSQSAAAERSLSGQQAPRADSMSTERDRRASLCRARPTRRGGAAPSASPGGACVRVPKKVERQVAPLFRLVDSKSDDVQVR